MAKPNATIQHIGNGFYYIIMDGRALIVRADSRDELIKELENDFTYYAKKIKAMGRTLERD